MFFTRLLGACLAAGERVPSVCAICHTWPAKRVCATCVTRFSAPAARCCTCAMRVPEGVQHCGQCLREPTRLQHCLAAVDYAWPWADLVTQLKFHAEPALTSTLAQIMQHTAGTPRLLDRCDALVPVPLAPGRLRERGYNQSLLLARHLHAAKLRSPWLTRSHETITQTRLDRHARLRNLLGAFAVPEAVRPALQGAHVVLVDDVMTTGATLHAAATALRAAGAGEVSALVFARTP